MTTATTREAQMHPDLKAFSVEVPVGDDAKMADLNEALDELVEATNRYIQKVAKELQVTEECATAVWYLRTRSRWTQAHETELIRLHRAGTPPNIFDWP